MDIDMARWKHFTSKAFAAVLICAASAFAAATNAQAVQLIRPHTGPLNLPSASGASVRATPVLFNLSAMQEVRSGGEVDFTLPNAQHYSIVIELAQSHGDGITSWTGYLKDYGKRYRALITAGPDGTYARIETPTGDYRLAPATGHDWLIDMVAEAPYLPEINLGNDGLLVKTDQAALTSGKLRGEPALQTAVTGVNSVGLSTATPTPQAVVDLMFVVTTGLANRLGGNLMTRLNFLVTTANDTFAQSEVAITMRLVHVAVVDYPDTASDNAALSAITPGSGGGAGVFSNIETLRNTYGADVVSFLRNGADMGGSGLAWVPVPTTSNLMYSTVQGCVTGCESVFIHEVGHNMGNSHDRATVAWEEGGVAVPPSSLFPYSFGYFYCSSGLLSCNPNLPSGAGGCASNVGPRCATSHADNFGTIMSYFNPTLYRFSNPNITCGPSGGTLRACGASNSADNTLSMNNNRFTLSAIKSTAVVALPGSIQFTNSAFTASEASGTLTATVSRIGGSSGAISATYTTSNGSALAGLDFAQTVGTVSWADGDTASKSISIPIVNDGITEGGENFVITLTNPSGAAGVYLGSPSVASGVISEDWPPGGTFPSNFGTSSGSLAWTVATDQVFEGTNSLRSARVISSSGSNVNSDLTFTGNFNAGIVAFAYRVSSYQGIGLLEFLVDNVVVTSDSGETGWKSYSYQITAGTHTLVWRFKNRLTFACNGNVTPPSQGGAACADRAWIDALVLPLVLARSTSTVSASANPSSAGQSVTLTTTVAGSAGSPTGFVVFRDGAAVIAGCSAVPIVSGTAQCVTRALTEGSHSITGQYSGNATYVSSTSSLLTQTVGPATAKVFPLVPVLMLLLL